MFRVSEDSAEALDLRRRITDAASRCLVEHGLERTFISAIAREAGVSRQTIYNHFATKEDIVNAAIQNAAIAATERMVAVAEQSGSAAEFVVELCIAALAEFPGNPAISPMFDVLNGSAARNRIMAPEVIATARRYLEPILFWAPHLDCRLDEMTETYLRIELSLLTIKGPHDRTDDELRNYLHRILVPALGLSNP